MLDRPRKKNFILRLLYSQKFLAVLGLAIMVLISFPLVRIINQRYKIDKEVKDLETEISELEAKNKDFKELISYLESDQFVEEQARLSLGLKKEGEEVVGIEEPATAGDDLSAATDTERNLEGRANPVKWWYYFFERL